MLRVRLSDLERNMLEVLAESAGLTASDIVRQLVRQAYGDAYGDAPPKRAKKGKG